MRAVPLGSGLMSIVLAVACAGDRVAPGGAGEVTSEDGGSEPGSPMSASTTVMPDPGGGDTLTSTTGTSTSTGLGGGTSGAEDTDFGMDDDMPLLTSIPSIKEGTVPLGTLVQLCDVVLTTDSTDARLGSVGELYLQDPMGGAYSGIFVRTTGGPAKLIEGETVDIIGRVRAGVGYRFISAQQQAIFPSSEKSKPVVPELIEIDTLQPFHPNVSSYEGVVVELVDLTVTGQEQGNEPILQGQIYVDWRFYQATPPILEPGISVFTVVGPLMITPMGLAIGPRTPDDLVY